jgi:hypothetical protein
VLHEQWKPTDLVRQGELGAELALKKPSSVYSSSYDTRLKTDSLMIFVLDEFTPSFHRNTRFPLLFSRYLLITRQVKDSGVEAKEKQGTFGGFFISSSSWSTKASCLTAVEWSEHFTM